MHFNTLTYISGKLLRNGKGKYSGVIVNIAIAAVAISVCIMLVSAFVLKGFQTEITNKIVGFSGDISISNFSSNKSLFNEAMVVDDELKAEVKKQLPNCIINTYAIKGGIVKTKTDIEGAVLKGVGKDYNWAFFSKNLVTGRLPNLNNDSIHEVIISTNLANKLKLHLSENMLMYFIQQPARIRKFKIVGLYNTGLEEFDNKFIFCGIDNVQKLNNWDSNNADALEVILNNNNPLQESVDRLYSTLPPQLNVESVKEIYPQLFDWLQLQNLNVLIIIVMMFLVGTINMITALLILILEKTRTIGLLKTIGVTTFNIQKIFIMNSVKLIFKGAVIGNAIAILFALLQMKFHLISLDASSYYMQYVPIKMLLSDVLQINGIVILVTAICMFIPTIIVRNISPAQAVKFS